MRVQRGNSTYIYSSQRINGQPVTHYIGRSTSPQARAYQQRQEDKLQHREREDALAQLQTAVDRARDAIHLMIRGHLLLAGYFERKSEIRKLQEEHCA